MHNGEFQYLKDYESRIEALVKGSKGEVEIWVDMPAHQNDKIRETQGNPVPFRLFREGNESEGIESRLTEITIRAPLRLRILPGTCEKLIRSEEIEEVNFIPPLEILEKHQLDEDGKDRDGTQFVVYATYHLNGVMGDPVRLSRNRLHLRVKDTLSRQKISQLGIRKPHIAFIEECINEGIKRSHAWNKLKQLARDTKGSKPSKIPWTTEIYLKSTVNPDELLYKNEPFLSPKDPGEKISKQAFFSAWSRQKEKKRS